MRGGTLMISDVFAPSSLAEAVQVLAEIDEKVLILAGGTDLLVRLRRGHLQPSPLVLDIRSISELRYVREEDGEICVGALSTWEDVIRSELLAQECPILVEAARGFEGALQLSRATIGGNVMAASPSGDAIPPLMTAGATCSLRSAEGERRVPVYAFYPDYRATVAGPTELLVEVRIPRRPEGSYEYFRKVVVSRPRGLAKVSLAARLAELERSPSGLTTAADVRLVVGGVAETPLRVFETEAWLKDRVIDPESIARAAERMRTEIRPIDDRASTSTYRKIVAGRLLAEVLTGVAKLPYVPL